MPEGTTETPVFDTLAMMTAASLENSSLDPEAIALSRFVALVAIDAPAVSYLINLGAMKDDLDIETIQGALVAIAPIVGTARVASAASNITKALGIAVEIAAEELAAAEGSDM
jgi:hypothetical protein